MQSIYRNKCKDQSSRQYIARFVGVCGFRISPVAYIPCIYNIARILNAFVTPVVPVRTRIYFVGASDSSERLDVDFSTVDFSILVPPHIPRLSLFCRHSRIFAARSALTSLRPRSNCVASFSWWAPSGCVSWSLTMFVNVLIFLFYRLDGEL